MEKEELKNNVVNYLYLKGKKFKEKDELEYFFKAIRTVEVREETCYKLVDTLDEYNYLFSVYPECYNRVFDIYAVDLELEQGKREEKVLRKEKRKNANILGFGILEFIFLVPTILFFQALDKNKKK